MQSNPEIPAYWMGPSEPILALVAGYPSPKRERRWLVVLNGYCDESEDETVFVLAGYVAPAEEWAKFTQEWHSTLHATPAIWEFHCVEAMSRRGNFNEFTEKERDKKLEDLYAVIDKYISFEVSAIVLMEPFKRIYGNGILPKGAANPYYDASALLVSGVAKQQMKDGMKETIDFIFDERKEAANIQAIWEMARETAPPDVKPMLGKTPIFRPDSEVLPLQAADMEAWWLRKRWREKLTGEPRLEYPWQPSNMPSVTVVADEEKIKETYEKVLQFHLDSGWRPGKKGGKWITS